MLFTLGGCYLVGYLGLLLAPARAGLLVVMLTAKGRETEVAKGLAIGADAYVTKPFSTKDLVTRVKGMLGV